MADDEQGMDDRLTAVTDQLTAAVRRQADDRNPAHEDFYTWGWALSDIIRRLDDVAGVLGRQVGRYGDNKILRDDQDADPTERLTEAGAHLQALRSSLSSALRSASDYHSAVGHVAVEVEL
ncbi:hypothetical protein ACL02T_34490 [Pseudonocardia sp. RS010]|uniref:hypothetical protein n=1 Tax=Pseudonocardia sp. RS010 TaxID=3385979 RepID=UPI0039A057DE